ncbi:MAG: FecR domain-containing protein [Niastella sp.]|nr:FecR domain-containing protein [Niastella sp.]
MTTGSQHIIHLLEKYARREATSGEVNELLTLLRTGDHDETVTAYIEQNIEAFEPGDAEDIAFWKDRLAGGAQKITGAVVAASEAPAIDMHTQVRPVHCVHFLRRWGWAAAAAILALYAGIYIWKMNTKEAARTDYAVDTKYIEPGKNGAILTLADGTRVVLDSLGNGVVATQNGTQVLLKNGALAYDAANAAAGAVGYNMMVTPKGRQFQVTLPDGTRVWLNAASSLRYPTVFTGAERRVEVTGEAYFEVAHNAKMPFRVNAHNKAAIEVLGTHFNVNAYENEKATSTTLLEGKVKVAETDSLLSTPDSRLLKPGQQAQVVHRSNTGGAGVMVVNNNVDINKVMAWKNGLFNFEGASLGEVMRQIERWYDIEVAYEKGIPNIEFEGKMTKDVPLKDLLVMLEKSDIHFRIEDRKLIVLP